MKNSRKNNLNLIIKISLIILFWPFVLTYYLFKKYSQKRKENLEKRKILKQQEMERFRKQQKDYTSPYWISVMNIIRDRNK